MIRDSKKLLLGAALASCCYAQMNLPTLPSPTVNNTLMNLTFSDPRASNCGNSSTSANESATIVIRTSPNGGACLNLDYIFTHPNETYAPSAEFNTTDAGMRYSVTSPMGNASVGWSPNTYNYSQVFYTQRRPNIDQSENDKAFGALMVRAFEQENCPGNGDDMSAATWYSWNCQDEAGTCSTVPYGVKSLYITGPEKGNQVENPGDKGCVNAVKYDGVSAASGRGAVSGALGLGAAVLAALTLW